jgi:hypothetical protein
MEPACKLPDGRQRDEHVFDAAGRCECGREQMRYAPRPELRDVVPPPPRKVRSLADLERPVVVKHPDQSDEMRKLPARRLEQREGETMPKSDPAEQTKARQDADRKRLGCKPWHPGGPGRPPKHRNAVLAAPKPRPARRAVVPLGPVSMAGLLGPEFVAALPRVIAGLEAQRAKIDSTIAALKALQA